MKNWKCWRSSRQEKKSKERDFAGEYAFCRLKLHLSREEYFSMTEREYIALFLGWAEQQGSKTEYDDMGDFFGAGKE